ncbi:hypothetical protein SDC9_80852 [bioreactor metagenome]|uniref:Uncharacterized protein n=1 Tax=bioreactor metagenome TaxID=1076179 RepID=A0A644Z072_9ZZZZ
MLPATTMESETPTPAAPPMPTEVTIVSTSRLELASTLMLPPAVTTLPAPMEASIVLKLTLANMETPTPATPAPPIVMTTAISPYASRASISTLPCAFSVTEASVYAFVMTWVTIISSVPPTPAVPPMAAPAASAVTISCESA